MLEKQPIIKYRYKSMSRKKIKSRWTKTLWQTFSVESRDQQKIDFKISPSMSLIFISKMKLYKKISLLIYILFISFHQTLIILIPRKDIFIRNIISYIFGFISDDWCPKSSFSCEKWCDSSNKEKDNNKSIKRKHKKIFKIKKKNRFSKQKKNFMYFFKIGKVI